MKSIKITVTAEDIANGRKRTCWACPIALAVNRELGFMFRSEVGRYSIIIGPNKKSFAFPEHDMETLFDAPLEVGNFVRDFDEGVEVKPFTFKLE